MNILVKWQLVLALGYSCLIIIHEKNSWKQTSYTPWQITVIVILWNFPMAMWLYYKYSNSADVQNVVIVTNVTPVFKVFELLFTASEGTWGRRWDACSMDDGAYATLFGACPPLVWSGHGAHVHHSCKIQKHWHICEIYIWWKHFLLNVRKKEK